MESLKKGIKNHTFIHNCLITWNAYLVLLFSFIYGAFFQIYELLLIFSTTPFLLKASKLVYCSSLKFLTPHCYIPSTHYIFI